MSFPITDDAHHKVESLVENINGKYFGHEIYVDTTEKAVAYLYFLIKNHPFVDGNKRTACLVFEVVCSLNDIVPQYDGFTLDELAIFLEQKPSRDYQTIIKTTARLLFEKKQ